MKKLLITGAGGFIGRSITENFESFYEVHPLNRTELDLNDSKSVLKKLKKNQYDIIIHCANYDSAPKNSLRNSSLVIEKNLSMFFNITRCSDYYGKLIYFGSGAEFCRKHWVPNMSETYFDEHVPKDPYGLSKYIMTKYTLKSKNITNLRLFGVFGQFDDWRYRFISNVCCHVVLGDSIRINQNALFDFLFIDDLLKIIKWFVDNESNLKVVNACTSKTLTFLEIAKKIIKISKKKIKIKIQKEGLRTEYSGNNSLLLSKMNNFKFTSIDSSLSDMYYWYEKNKGKIDPKQFHY